MAPDDKVNILLVDDQPAKLLSYEAILGELGENLIKAASTPEALTALLKHDIAVVLIDVCMPELDGFQLAAMIREHPRFQKMAIIFVSAVQIAEVDYLRGYEIGAVDYVPVPVVPEVLRAKVRVFVELYRKTRLLEQMNNELERRVGERTAALQSSNARLLESEARRTMALTAGRMGSWDIDLASGQQVWDEGQCRIFEIDPASFNFGLDATEPLLHPDDRSRVMGLFHNPSMIAGHAQLEFRIIRPSGELRWCLGTLAPTLNDEGKAVRLSGITVDITERKRAEEHQALLAREVDHRAKNALAVVQAIIRLTRAKTKDDYIQAIEGRIQALAATHKLLSSTNWEGANLRQIVDDEMAPYSAADGERLVIDGDEVTLRPPAAQTLALALHELATNAAKYGALSREGGTLRIGWKVTAMGLVIHWKESGGPATSEPVSVGFGLKFVRSGVQDQLGGRLRWRWLERGLECMVRIPGTQLATNPEEARTSRPNVKVNGHARSNVVGKRVLVVEDEMLIGMHVETVLEEMGIGVIGPVSSLDEGLSAAQQQPIDAAILDLNLSGSLSYPLADVLAARRIPFAFVTGYGADTVDQRYAHVPVVQKPIEASALQQTLLTGLLARSA